MMHKPNKTKNALIIFIKNPIKGKVKTRLAKSIGEEKALEIYRLLLEHTKNITSRLNCDKFIFYHDFIPEKDIWNTDDYSKFLQQGSNLGRRMQQAFKKVFNQGYKKIIIIGSDCYELEIKDIEESFKLLDKTSITIGPANDGGYYLLGMQDFFPEIFNGISWSTPDVLSETLQKLQQGNISYSLMEALTDIDTESDLPDVLKEKAGLLKTQITR